MLGYYSLFLCVRLGSLMLLNKKTITGYSSASLSSIICHLQRKCFAIVFYYLAQVQKKEKLKHNKQEASYCAS